MGKKYATVQANATPAAAFDARHGVGKRRDLMGLHTEAALEPGQPGSDTTGATGVR
jgi:hypothetical protein